MQDVVQVILYSGLAGMPVFFGGLLAYFFDKYFHGRQLKAEILHTAIAFGGGILFAAVALVLVPNGMHDMPLVPMIALFSLGAISFFLLERYVQKKEEPASQLLSMLMDFIPEAISLGAVFATNPNLGLLLAIFIGLQNLPESFNSYGDLIKSGFTSRTTLVILFLLSFSGIISAIAGYYLLSDMPMTIAGLMLFSSGGIVYLLFQDIAPMSKLKKNWFPALGASLGFLMGMVGVKILG
jgi:ZIP family zinc transporter